MATKDKEKVAPKTWLGKFFEEHPEIKHKLNLYFSLSGGKRKCNPMKNKLKKKVYNKLHKIFGDLVN